MRVHQVGYISGGGIYQVGYVRGRFMSGGVRQVGVGLLGI